MPKYAEEILAAVTELQQHPTAEQVFLEMKREHPSIALGTVYKHLNGLAEEGLLLRITEPGSPDRYDRTERHDHLICSRCGKIADVHLPDTGAQESNLGQAADECSGDDRFAGADARRFLCILFHQGDRCCVVYGVCRGCPRVHGGLCGNVRI